MNTKSIGLWSFVIGTILALATVFLELGDWANQVIIILGLMAGVFHFDKNGLVPLGVIYFALTAASSSAGELIAFGPYITGIANAWVGFLGPVVLMAFMLWGAPMLLSQENS